MRKTPQLPSLAPMDGRVLGHGSALHVLDATNPARALQRAQRLSLLGGCKLSCDLLAILAPAVGGAGMRGAVITEQHLLAAGVLIDAVNKRIGAGSALHAVT